MGRKAQKRKTGEGKDEEALRMVRDTEQIKKMTQELAAERNKNRRALQLKKRQFLLQMKQERERMMTHMAEMQAFFVFEIHGTRMAAQQIANHLQVQTEQITNMEATWINRLQETIRVLRNQDRRIKSLDSDLKHLVAAMRP